MARALSQLAATPVTVLKGVGPERARALERLEVTNVLDVLTYYPRRYLDRTREAKIADLRVGEEATVLVEVKSTTGRHTRGGKALVTCDVTDGSAHLMMSGSIRNVSPVVSLDGLDIDAGPVSMEAQRLFQARLADDLDP